ncbi:MAG TPA: cupin domain-containing protein [Acidobacteriota bacterium]|nr:cupin domain-containing protein [Acidobacteriota bacterium]
MNADEVIRRLNLQPHPREAGFFAETHRSGDRVAWEALPATYDGTRCFSTAIYFLLKADGFSEMHRLRSDEIYHFYKGAPAEMLLLFPDGSGKILRLGNDLDAGEVPQIVVPRNVWQGMIPLGDYTLSGCTVSPGFEYSDYQAGQREDLIRKYPQWTAAIARRTR